MALPGRIAVSLAGFFTTNPDYEAPSIDVATAQATSLHADASNAQQTVATAAVTQKTKGDANDAAYTGLAIAMRTVIDGLGKVLGAYDPRWLAFGLNMPGANVTPSQPINVTATVDAFGSTILVTCDAVALATRYRARMLRVGVETEYQLVASGIEPMLSIGGVLAGQTVKIVVQAVNGQVQGVPSAPVEITVALAKTAAAAAAAVVPEVTAFDTSAAPASNGSRNGHAEVVSARG